MLAQSSGDAIVWAAYLAAGPAALAAFAAWRNTVRTRQVVNRQLTPSNGTTLAETIEKTQRDLAGVKLDLSYHVSVQHGRGPVQNEGE